MQDDPDEKQAEESICKYSNDRFKREGNFPHELRFAWDSTALHMDAMTRSLNFKGNGECLIKATSKDNKRICTLHVNLRLKGEQIIDPVIIFESEAPNTDDPWQLPPGIACRRREWKSKKGTENEFYHPQSKVLWQKNA